MSVNAALQLFNVPVGVERVTLKSISSALKTFVKGLVGGKPPAQIPLPCWFNAFVRKEAMALEEGLPDMVCVLQSAVCEYGNDDKRVVRISTLAFLCMSLPFIVASGAPNEGNPRTFIQAKQCGGRAVKDEDGSLIFLQLHDDEKPHKI